MTGQQAYGWRAYAQNTVETWEMTVEVDNRDTFAETAITGFGNEGESPFGYFGITRIVSDSGTETFLAAGSFGASSYRQAVYRTGVTSVRVQLACWDSWVRGRLLLNYW
jgi:hypothetical protein